MKMLKRTQGAVNHMWAGMSMVRYPDFISKDLIMVVPIVPDGCMEVWEGKDDRCERALEKMVKLRKSGLKV